MKLMERWPNFFIVGAPKAGTTSLHEYLNKVPSIFMSKIKEPNYFSASMMPNKFPFRPIRDSKKYLNLFNKAKNEKIIGESSTLYLYDPEAPKLIHEKNPNARILISLRDPIERLFSHYLLVKNEGFAEKSFHQQIINELHHKIDPSKSNMRLVAGNHYKCVKRYLDTFGAQQVKIIIFEEWIKNPKLIIVDILKFLNIDENLDNFIAEDHNAYLANRWEFVPRFVSNPNVIKIRDFLPSALKAELRKMFVKKVKKPKIDEKDIEFLKNYYKDDIENLKKILGRNLPWPNFQN